MTESYVLNVGANFEPEPEEPIMESLFQQYERVIVESLISSFGLDFLVKDRHGGDVDTIHNVRQIGSDERMTYKNAENQRAYEQRGQYDKSAYHDRHPNYGGKTKEMREAAKKEGKPVAIKDEYTGGTVYVLGHSKGAPPSKKAILDHVKSAKSIHDDRGRVLAGLSGEDLANSKENLAYTNTSLNSSMQDKEIPDYIEAHPELDADTKENMMRHYNESQKSYDAKIARAYYTSPKFAKDLTKAAGTVGLQMGARQALGFVFAEMWFSVKEEFKIIQAQDSFDFQEVLTALGNGLKKGLERAKEKYSELFSRFLNGAVGGALSSLTTALCNIFFTTAKNTVKVIRQTWASLVEAAKVLFINPDNYTFGERMRAVAKILATGASVVVGVLASEAVKDSPLGAIPVLGDVAQTFCGAFVTGIMTCSLLFFLDRNELVNKLVKVLDNVSTIEDDIAYFRRQAEYFERYAAELMRIDLDQFKKETTVYTHVAGQIAAAATDEELNVVLKNAMKSLGIPLPWSKSGHDSFDSFMRDKNARLVFE